MTRTREIVGEYGAIYIDIICDSPGCTTSIGYIKNKRGSIKYYIGESYDHGRFRYCNKLHNDKQLERA